MSRPQPRKAEFPGGEQSRRSMCSKRERALLVPYALTGCRQDEGVAFEAHMLQCDACYEDLKLLDRAAALIGDWAVARLTLADLFYNAPASDAPASESPGSNGTANSSRIDRLRTMLAAIPPANGNRALGQG